MTDLKFDILDFIYNSPDRKCARTALFDQHLASTEEVWYALDDLTETVYDRELQKETPPLIIKSFDNTTLKLTSSGSCTYESVKEARYVQAKQEADKATEQCAKSLKAEVNMKKQFRHDFLIATFTAIFSSLLTLLFEHFHKLVNAIFSLL